MNTTGRPIPERFMGLQGCVLSNQDRVTRLGNRAGLAPIQIECNGEDPDEIACLIAEVLGVVKSSNSDTCELLLVHIDASSTDGLSGKSSNMSLHSETKSLPKAGIEVGSKDVTTVWLEWIDDLLRALNKQDGFIEMVLTCAILGDFGVNGKPILQLGQKQIVGDAGVPGRCNTTIRPLQSCEMLRNKQVEVYPDQPLVIVRRLQGVVRTDEVTSISSAHLGSSGAILVEHVVPEIAYKLARSKKYGA